MLDYNELSDDVVSAILQQKGWPEEEESYDKLSKLSAYEAWDAYLIWNGIIGFSEKLANAHTNICKAVTS